MLKKNKFYSIMTQLIVSFIKISISYYKITKVVL